jgi:hypothetical protein
MVDSLSKLCHAMLGMIIVHHVSYLFALWCHTLCMLTIYACEEVGVIFVKCSVIGLMAHMLYLYVCVLH